MFAVHGDGTAWLWDLDRGVRIDGGGSGDVIAGTVRGAGPLTELVTIHRDGSAQALRLGGERLTLGNAIDGFDAGADPAVSADGRRDGLPHPGRPMAWRGDGRSLRSPARRGERGKAASRSRWLRHRVSRGRRHPDCGAYRQLGSAGAGPPRRLQTWNQNHRGGVHTGRDTRGARRRARPSVPLVACRCGCAAAALHQRPAAERRGRSPRDER